MDHFVNYQLPKDNPTNIVNHKFFKQFCQGSFEGIFSTFQYFSKIHTKQARKLPSTGLIEVK